MHKSPFELVEIPLGTVARHVLRHASGQELEVLTGMGGSITGWRIPWQGEILHLMEGYASEEELRGRFGSSHCGARLTPFPNRVRSGVWRWRDKEYALPCNFPWEQGHAIHGLLFDRSWRVVSWHAAEHFAVLTLEFSYDGSEPGYPFPYDAITRYCLGQNAFQIETMVRNTGKRKMPLGEGWHPYFGFGDLIDHLELQLPSEVFRLEVDDRSIPTGVERADAAWSVLRPLGDAQINTCWRIASAAEQAVVRLRSPRRGEIRYWQEWGEEQYCYVQLYTPPHRRYLAIEPMTCAPDVFNHHRHLITVLPGEKKSWVWGAEWVSPESV